MNKLISTLLFSFVSLLGFSQNDFGPDPCEFEHYGSTYRIEDSIEFYVNYNSTIDLQNENCPYMLAEDYYNIAPSMQTNTLCVIYIDGAPATEEIEFIALFDRSDEMAQVIDRIQLVFVTDKRTGLWREYQTKEDIARLFTLDVRTGIKKEN